MKVSKINERLLEVRMVQAHIEMGRSELMACRIVGISHATYKRWASRFKEKGYEGVIARASDTRGKQQGRK